MSRDDLGEWRCKMDGWIGWMHLYHELFISDACSRKLFSRQNKMS